MAEFGVDGAMLLDAYRCAAKFLSTAGCFTNEALHAALPMTGYRQDEVDDALALMEDRGLLFRLTHNGETGVSVFTPGRGWS